VDTDFWGFFMAPFVPVTWTALDALSSNLLTMASFGESHTASSTPDVRNQINPDYQGSHACAHGRDEEQAVRLNLLDKLLAEEPEEEATSWVATTQIHRWERR
jgi:hypothetical protein